MTKNIRLIHAFEQLAAVDNAEGEKKTQLLKEYGAKSPLNFILSLNFNHGVNLDLPEGMPPMDLNHMDVVTHPDLAGLLSTSIQRLRHCVVESDLKKLKKEQIFYDVIINVPLKDAEILCSAKDRCLTELYPTITAEFVSTVFPNYVKAIECPVQ